MFHQGKENLVLCKREALEEANLAQNDRLLELLQARRQGLRRTR
jgi:hypothetical protein